MKTKIVLFGMLADVAGQPSIEVTDCYDTATILKKVRELNDDFAIAKFVIAVNKKVVTENQPINVNDEVALLPPFAGG